MECKRVKIVGGRSIECTDIVPNTSLPGFFDIWLKKGERRIVNASAIVEVVEHDEPQPFVNLEKW